MRTEPEAFRHLHEKEGTEPEAVSKSHHGRAQSLETVRNLHWRGAQSLKLSARFMVGVHTARDCRQIP